ncbi:hypothetical protein LR48_Vigan50s000300 [Vigna angularis]|uniref:Reverse transcriptase domain-containing protein n=1 Tax=Phaseolus angularis TaxID=3914 RepID=A0A0L9T3D4_PHAAN|nr:hypothetical protein LR48_Vigan50s000300 [Vigna angularis]
MMAGVQTDIFTLPTSTFKHPLVSRIANSSTRPRSGSTAAASHGCKKRTHPTRPTSHHSLSPKEEENLVEILKANKGAIGWSISDLKGISPTYCMHKIFMEDDYKPVAQPQRRLNPVMEEEVRKEVLKLLEANIIYPISDSAWVSPVQVVPKKGGMTVIYNEKNELIPTRTVTGWRICIDYIKLNSATRKDHFPLPFMDQMLERLAGQAFYCFLDGTLDIIKLWWIQKTKKRRLSLIHLEFLLTEKCCLGYVMLQLLFKDSCRQSLQT